MAREPVVSMSSEESPVDAGKTKRKIHSFQVIRTIETGEVPNSVFIS